MGRLRVRRLEQPALTATPHRGGAPVAAPAAASHAARAALVAALDDPAWRDLPAPVSVALVDAIAAIPAPPCEGCPTHARCGRERLACTDFRVYVTTGTVGRRARRPDRHLYLELFNGGH